MHAGSCGGSLGERSFSFSLIHARRRRSVLAFLISPQGNQPDRSTCVRAPGGPRELRSGIQQKLKLPGRQDARKVRLRMLLKSEILTGCPTMTGNRWNSEFSLFSPLHRLGEGRQHPLRTRSPSHERFACHSSWGPLFRHHDHSYCLTAIPLLTWIPGVDEALSSVLRNQGGLNATWLRGLKYRG